MATSEPTKCDAIRWLIAAAPLIGCTTVLGIDGDYTARGDGSAITASGGSGTGGSGAKGGTGASSTSGGSGGSGGQTDAPVCSSSQKLCSGVCVAPQPLVGCTLQGCEPCPPPVLNAVDICSGQQCSMKCITGYDPDPVNGSCVPSGSGGSGGGGGGSGGTGGTGGTAGSSGTGGTGGGCTASQCGPCNPAGPFPCCKMDHTCGCTWAPGAACY